jgi:hypothetical protein
MITPSKASVRKVNEFQSLPDTNRTDIRTDITAILWRFVATDTLSQSVISKQLF